MSLCEVSAVVDAVELFVGVEGPPTEILYMKNEGNIHDSYEVRFSNQKCYVLQRINDVVFTNPEALMSNLDSVLHFIGQKDTEFIASLQFLRTYSGATWGKNSSGSWRMMPFLGECGQSKSSPPTLLHAKQSARAFGLFSQYLLDFKADTLVTLLPGFHDTCKYLEEFQKLVVTDPLDRLRFCQKEVDLLQEFTLDTDIKNLLNILKGKTSFPNRVIHGDAKYSNVALSEQGDKILSVIDLDTVMQGPIVYDLGDFLRTVCPNICEEDTDIDLLQIRKDYYEQCVRSYLGGLGSSVDSIELEYLHMSLPLVSYELSIRFVADYLQGDIYFKTHHKNHNLDRSRNQIQLVKVFLEERSFFKKLHNFFFKKGCPGFCR